MNNRIKQARKKLNLTQKKFGENLNLSESHISNLEKGRVNLTARNIDDICSTYNINQVWLETGEGDIFSELTKDDEFNILVGKLVAEEDSFKKKVIEEMLKLDDEDCINVSFPGYFDLIKSLTK